MSVYSQIQIVVTTAMLLVCTSCGRSEPAGLQEFFHACATNNAAVVALSAMQQSGHINQTGDFTFEGQLFRKASALHIAAYYGHAEIVQLLIDHGATLESVDGVDQTPLITAIAGKATNARAIQVLIDSGANLEAPGIQGTTPILFATMAGRIDIIGMLLERGADVHARNEFGSGIYSVAIVSGHGPPFLFQLKEMIPLPPVGDDGFPMAPGTAAVYSRNVAALRWLESVGYDPRHDLRYSGALFSLIGVCDAAMVSELARLRPLLLTTDARGRTVKEAAQALQDCPQKEIILCLLDGF